MDSPARAAATPAAQERIEYEPLPNSRMSGAAVGTRALASVLAMQNTAMSCRASARLVTLRVRWLLPVLAGAVLLCKWGRVQTLQAERGSWCCRRGRTVRETDTQHCGNCRGAQDDDAAKQHGLLEAVVDKGCRQQGTEYLADAETDRK